MSKKKKNNKRKKVEFSKILIIQESALIWVITLAYLLLAFICVFKDYTGSLPWLSVIPGVAWTAYGASQAFYYNKAKAENTKNGVKYETVLAELTNNNNNKEEIDIDYGI